MAARRRERPPLPSGIRGISIVVAVALGLSAAAWVVAFVLAWLLG